MTAADQSARDQAIDPTRSFCVSAPAGSGKTELLTQRLLALLARVQRPEQVLAITFTRKAASEMAQRVLEKLEQARIDDPVSAPHERVTRQLAQGLLTHAANLGWCLDETSLNLRTIDSFCHELARQMPILSGIGGAVEPVDDAQPLYEDAVRSFLLQAGNGPVGEGIRRLLLQFDNRWSKVSDLLVALLQRRGDWGSVVGQHRDPSAAEFAIRRTLQELTSQHLAGIAESLGSQLGVLEQLVCDARENLDKPGVRLVPAESNVQDWRELARTLLTKEHGWRKPGGVNKNLGFPAGSELKSQFVSILEPLSSDERLRDALVETLFIPAHEPGDAAWDLVVLISSLMPALQAHLLVVFQESGQVDHTHITLAALQALGTDEQPTRLAERLDYQIEHILIDEFQDTSASQAMLLERITRGWYEHNEGAAYPRTLFVVGDAMQSIYGFRDADVSLFLQARQGELAGLPLESLELTRNFRSCAPVIDWVNKAFTSLFGSTDQPNYGRVSHVWAECTQDEVEGASPGVHVRLFEESAEDAEARYLAAKIAALRDEIPEASIAVLVRTRSHAKLIARALSTHRVPFNGDVVQGLSENPAVQDLLALTSWLINPADNVAALALLRTPWCGLGLNAINQLLAPHPERPFDLLAVLSDASSVLTGDDVRRAQHLEIALRWGLERQDRLALDVWLEQIWLRLGGPQCCQQADLEAVQSLFVAVRAADQAGVGLDVAWLERDLQTSPAGQTTDPIAVRILTMHKAKGLEFDYVFMPLLSKRTRGVQRDLIRWHWQHTARARGLLIAANDGDSASQSLYNYLNWLQKKKDQEELKRLLYVGVTRARVAAFLSGTFSRESGEAVPVAPEGSLLNVLLRAEHAAQALALHPPSDDTAAGTPELTVTGAGASLRRLPTHSLAIPQPYDPDTNHGAANASHAGEINRDSNRLERVIGIVVHRVLELLAHAPSLPTACDDKVNGWITSNVQFHWLPPAQAQAAIEACQALVSRALSCEKGRWILSASSEAVSEMEITKVVDREVQRYVIDRTFYDEASNARWIVDFKTAMPAEGETIEAFEERELARYGAQLDNYADLASELSWEREVPIKKALYYPGIQHLSILNA